MTVSIVIPSNRPECLPEFFKAWEKEFAGHEVILVNDGPVNSPFGVWLRQFCWADIDAELGKDAWIIPRRTDCVRSFGFLKATGDVIITLDDDCLPIGQGFVEAHLRNLEQDVTCEAWETTISSVKPRGMPFQNKTRQMPCMISHGLWRGVPDLDAITQLSKGESYSMDVRISNKTIERGRYFPMCGMNLAFKREILPAMYFLLMGRDYPYDRFGDIWAGLFAKRICDHLGYSIHSGDPCVLHQRASDPMKNLAKESPGYQVNEWLWKVVDRMRLNHPDVRGCYYDMADGLPNEPYWNELKKAMSLWCYALNRMDPRYAVGASA